VVFRYWISFNDLGFRYGKEIWALTEVSAVHRKICVLYDLPSIVGGNVDEITKSQKRFI
jgi:hypothetical protein